MEETINQRITLVLKENSLTVTAMARRLNISQTTLSLQLKGERALSAHIVELIMGAFPDVSAEWLMRGKGEMYQSGESPTSSLQPSSQPEPSPVSSSDSEWKAKYEELEKRYDQLLSVLCGRQSTSHQPLSDVG